MFNPHLHAGAVIGPTPWGDDVLHFGDPVSEYAALLSSVALFDLSNRTQVELNGADRAKFLHNLCTNEIRKLSPGEGCEAFLTNAQGKILFHVFVFCRAESIVLETMPGQGERLVAHLDRFLIREQVELHDRSQEWCEFLVAGPKVGELTPPQLSTLDSRLSPLTFPEGHLITVSRDRATELWQSLVAAGAQPAGYKVLNAARIEAGFPFYGQDISDENLPQEVARDGRAISFVKGCYIGQETVARIDALGHVNRTLCGVRFTGEQVPEPGTELTSPADGKVLGRVTSAAFSRSLSCPLALAYLRRGSNQPGQALKSPLGDAEVVSLPVVPHA